MSERMRILIAHDGSKCADDAIDDLPRAGLPREANALIVHVQDRWLPSSLASKAVEEVFISASKVAAKPARSNGGPEVEAVNESLASLDRASQRTRSYYPEWAIQTLSLKGSPAPEIIRQAKEWNASLIVIGSHGCTKSKSLILGSVSHKVANEAACSVRVVRGQAWKNGSPSRLIIGLDGSAGAGAAVEEVARRMWTMGSEVRLVAARDTSEQNYKLACEFLEEARKILDRAELGVSELLEEGDPKHVIVASAEEWGADCIFLGPNDTPGFYENHLLGSVSTSVVARAHCMVEIVR